MDCMDSCKLCGRLRQYSDLAGGQCVPRCENMKLTAKQARELGIDVPPKRNKYGAIATVVDGIRFASAKEAQRYGELKLLLQAGLICNLVAHPVYKLHAPSGAVVGKYVADFRYFDGRASLVVVEDVKAPPTRTALYKWKRRHLNLEYGIEIRET